MEKIFLIGGSGFIGKNLVNYLSGRYDIFVIDKSIDVNYFFRTPCHKNFENRFSGTAGTGRLSFARLYHLNSATL